MRARSLEFDECDLAGVIELTDTDGAGFGEQVHGRFGPVGERDRPVFDERGLLDAFAAFASRGLHRGFGGDLVDGEPAEVVQQSL